MAIRYFKALVTYSMKEPIDVRDTGKERLEKVIIIMMKST